MKHLSLHPTLRTCSADTILRGISELSCANTTYTSDTGKVYDFNTAFVFKFISMPAKWIRTARHYQLNIYTDNKSYQNPFAFTDG